jgi:hypothetical protein
VVAGERSTAGLVGAGLLDAGTRFFGELLDFADLPVTARTARLEWRRSWVEQALAATRALLRLPEQHRGSEHPLWGVERSTILEPYSTGAPYVRN